MQFLSKFSKLILSIVLALNCLHYKLQPKINVLEIKDLYNVLMPNPKYEYPQPTSDSMMWETSYNVTPEKCYEYTSPIFGALLWETDYVKNFYRIAPESKTKNLVKELFFLQFDDVTFDITNNPVKPAYYFSPETIGKIIGTIINFTLKKDTDSSLLQKDLTNIISTLFFESQKQEKGKKLILKKEILPKIKDFYSAILTRQNDTLKILQQNPERNKEKIEKIQRTIQINQGIQKNPQSTINKEKNKFVKAITEALNEENNLYPKHHTIFILLSFLWQKSDTKQNFFDYFLTLYNTLKKPENLFKPNYNLLTTENQTKFKEAKYSADEYNNYYDSTINIDDYEKLCFLFLGFDFFKNQLPPHLDMKGEVTYKDQSFPDCGETSLLNLLNVLFYDPQSHKFNFELIKALKPSPKLLKFYDEHLTIESMNNRQELHEAWAQVVSELTGVTYRNQICNIKAGLQNQGINNMFKVLENLFPEINKQTEQTILEKFAALLKPHNLEINIIMPQEMDNPQQIILSINKPNVNPFQLKWNFMSGHFVIEFPLISENFYKYKANILDKTNNEDFFVVTKYVIIGRTLIKDIDPSEINKSLRLYSTLMQKLDTEKALFFMHQIASNEIFDSQTTKTLLLNTYSIIPDNDEFSQKRARSYLHKMMPINEYMGVLKNVGVYLLINSIIAGKNTQYFQWIKNNIMKIKDITYISMIATYILEHTDSITDKTALATLYSVIKEVLNNISDETFLNNLFRSILALDPLSKDKNLLLILYSAISENLRKIKMPSYFIMEICLLTRSIKDKEILSILYHAVKENIQNLKNENPAYIINTMINTDFSDINKDFFKILNDWAIESLKQINQPDLNKQFEGWRAYINR